MLIVGLMIGWLIVHINAIDQSINHSINQSVNESVVIDYHRFGPNISSWAGLAGAALLFESTNSTNYTLVDQSAPVLTIGVALALSGSNELDIIGDANVPSMLQFAVDFINGFGGVSINHGNQSITYQLSVLYADHQSSQSMMRIIYADMIDQGIEILLGPYGDPMQVAFNKFLLSINQSINVSVVTGVSFEASTYQMGLSNLFGVWGSPYSYQTETLNVLDIAAKKSQAMKSINFVPCGFDCTDTNTSVSDLTNNFVSSFQSINVNLDVKSSTLPSPSEINQLNFLTDSAEGVSTICLFSVDTLIGRLVRRAVLEWIVTSNEKRSMSEKRSNVSLIIDVMLPDRDGLVSEYVKNWLLCPQGTSLAIMPLNLATSKALEQSKRRFGYVIDLQTQNSGGLFPVIGWMSWYTFDGQKKSTIFPRYASKSDIITYYYYYWYGAGIWMPYRSLDNVVLRVVELTFIISALPRATGTSKAEFAAGMNALNGETSVLGEIRFDVDNRNVGVTEGNTYIYYLLELGGQYYYDNGQRGVYQFYFYPFDWPWYGRQYGDSLESSQEAYPLLFALIVAGIGSWLCFLLFEQSMFALSSSLKRNRVGEFVVFQLLSALMLTVAAISCAQFVLATAVSTHYPDDIDNEMKLSVTDVLRAWGYCWILTCLAFFVMSEYFMTLRGWLIARCKLLIGLSAICEVVNTDVKHTTQDSQASFQTYVNELVQLFRLVIHPRYLLSGLLIGCGVVISRETVFASWRQAAYYEVPLYAWIATLVMDGFLFSLVSTSLCHAFKWRIPAVFLFAGGVLVDWEIALLTTHFYYNPTSEPLTGVDPHTAMISAIIAASTVVILCLSIQYFRMHGTHNSLSELTTLKDAEMVSSKARKHRSDVRIARAKKMIRKMVAVLQTITLAVNPPLEFALSLALFHGHISQGIETEGEDTIVSESNPHSHHLLSNVRHSISEAVLSTPSHHNHNHVSIQPPSNQPIRSPPLPRRASIRLKNAFSSNSRASHLSAHSTSNSLDIQSVHRTPVAGSSYAETAAILALEGIAASSSWTQTFSQSLVGPRKVGARPVQHLTLAQMLSHPVCVELFKHECSRAYSLELLTFYLCAHKYRTFTSPVLRKLLAPYIYASYIAVGAKEEVNLSTEQRARIAKQITCGDFSLDLFLDAQRECFRLMEVNVFDKFVKNTTSGYMLACWCYVVMGTKDLGRRWLEFRGFDREVKSLNKMN